ncbi:Tripartite tricarboxylate transporter TctB family protein [Hartmannibacter diazotrophicus]|uniref:Tripartite tricarboxylate transporter TctB family protein n=1 Tax=Hartmannibacter diazotrophicus TaxID=1482074 RepID=A0A2C9D9E1_9HYPH|nr:tripartite tricarboxylate transporter TctB family protein [Hartmannibacter diazotrophicus]SON56917.1 Tripartite tricarboxylate transporter TctB family protein [Hartmannibacter diazotrophicus]
MAHEVNEKSEHTVSHRSVELFVAALLMVVALVVMYDNWKTGAGWAFDGPEAGYFPFWIGVILLVTSAGTFINTLRHSKVGLETFVERQQLKQILQVFIPAVVYVATIGYIGIYVSSAIFIGFFMIYLGKYPIYKVVPVSIGVPLFMFVLFEVWFLVPLPKGPLEAALGY